MLRSQTNKSAFKYVVFVLALVKFQTAVIADPLGETVNGLTSSLTSGLTNGLFSGLRDTLAPASRTPRARQYGAGMDPYNQQGPSMGYPAMNMYNGQMMGGPYGQMGQMGAFGMGPGGQHMWHQGMPFPPPPPPPFGGPYGPLPPFDSYKMNPYQQQYQPYGQMPQPMNQNNPYMMNPYQQPYGTSQRQQQPNDQNNPNNMMDSFQQHLQPNLSPNQQTNNPMPQQLDDQPLFARPAANDRG